jgi:molybdopterin-guanine dinucleotide biosynthesis protein B
MTKRTIPVISIVGRPKEGKTALIERLVAELKTRGYSVGTIKHHAHEDFEIDQPGKPTWRHTQAGASPVAISSPTKFALVRRVEKELGLDDIIGRFFPEVDIVLTEGYRKESKPKIEVVDSKISTTPICRPNELFLIVSDIDLDYNDIPNLKPSDTKAIADLIESKFL